MLPRPTIHTTASTSRVGRGRNSVTRHRLDLRLRLITFLSKRYLLHMKHRAVTDGIGGYYYQHALDEEAGSRA